MSISWISNARGEKPKGKTLLPPARAERELWRHMLLVVSHEYNNTTYLKLRALRNRRSIRKSRFPVR